jgi:predicted transcriptional regulator
MKKKETYMTVKDYASKFGITVQTVYNKIKNKELETKKILHTTLVKV